MPGIGRIVNVKQEGRKVILELELGEPQPSSTGKMNLEFSTGGWSQIEGDLRGSIMLDRYAKRR